MRTTILEILLSTVLLVRIVPAAQPEHSAAPASQKVLTGKERLGDKTSDEQGIGDCKVPPGAGREHIPRIVREMPEAHSRWLPVRYARLSTEDSITDHQLNELRAAGCAEIFEGHASCGDRDRSVLAQALARVRTGDTLIVVSLDRLARSLSHLLVVIEGLQGRGAFFRSLLGPTFCKMLVRYNPEGDREQAVDRIAGCYREFVNLFEED